MVSFVEQLYGGNLDVGLVNFDEEHFNDRSIKRKIPRKVVKDLFSHGEVLSCKITDAHDNRHLIVFRAPSKEYGNIKIVVKIGNNSIIIITVYEDKLTAPGSKRNYLKYPEKSLEEEWEEKALKKLRHY